MLLSLFKAKAKARRSAVQQLLHTTTQASRHPDLYAVLEVPDTVEGRFEALILHAILVLRRLRQLPPPASDAAQDFVDALFAMLDANLRELGVGDLSVGKKIKKLAEAFYGRAGMYNTALDDVQSDAALGEALCRNVQGKDKPDQTAAPFAAYVRRSEKLLNTHDLDAIFNTPDLFPDPLP